MNEPDRDVRAAQMWAASERRHSEKQLSENRARWRSFHLKQADGLERTAASLAADHRAKADAVHEKRLEAAAGVGDAQFFQSARRGFDGIAPVQIRRIFGRVEGY